MSWTALVTGLLDENPRLRDELVIEGSHSDWVQRSARWMAETYRHLTANGNASPMRQSVARETVIA